MADRGVFGPWDRKIGRPACPGQDIVHRKKTARSQYTADFSVQSWLVRDVHRCVLCPDNVERGIRERHVQGVALSEIDLVTEADKTGQSFSRLAILADEVQSGDTAPESGCNEAGGASDPAAHIQHRVAGFESELARQLPCRLEPADMKFVYPGDILGLEAL